ncbi:MAG: ThiF family adenylyltransferase [Bacilli bacterium]|nr:ThiF family adenylyltransferase [Bacilli bacterium]
MNQYERLELLLGKELVNKIQAKTVLVLGLGGVGGYAVESLARTGIQTLIIVDYDTISLSNMNRQVIATYETIGTKKVDAFEQRIALLSKNCHVIKIDEKITPENIDLLLQYRPDYIIDACDTLPVKMELIRKVSKTKIKLISSMGTGNKLDPSQLKIIDIRKTSYDPLAKRMRKMVTEEKIRGKVMVVSSEEKPIKTGSTTIASNAFVPPTAGLLLTSYIVNDVIKNEK